MSSGAKVLAVMGSPRKGGNTDALIDAVLEGAAAAGAATEKVILSDLRIGPCRGCNACAEKGRCVQEDDMHALAAKMKEASVWIFGTPVYWWGPTAWFKAFMDRWYGVIRSVPFKGKKVVLAIPLGDSDEATAEHTRGMLETALRYTGAEIVATVLAPGVGDRGDVARKPGLLDKARETGRLAVS